MGLYQGIAMFAKMLQEAKQQFGHYGLSDGQQIVGNWITIDTIIDAMIAAETLCLHHGCIATIAGSARL